MPAWPTHHNYVLLQAQVNNVDFSPLHLHTSQIERDGANWVSGLQIWAAGSGAGSVKAGNRGGHRLGDGRSTHQVNWGDDCPVWSAFLCGEGYGVHALHAISLPSKYSFWITFSRHVVPLFQACQDRVTAQLARTQGCAVHFTSNIWSSSRGLHIGGSWRMKAHLAAAEVTGYR